MTQKVSRFDVAVITPTHNRAGLLPAALDSVLAQTTDRRIEVAVVDDGSTDDTPQVMQRYMSEHGEAANGKVVIRYTRLEKQGVVTARNTAIDTTTAPYIAFLDSDDYWAREKLARQLETIESDSHVGVVHTSFRYVDEQGRFTDSGPQRLNNPCVGRCVDELLNEFRVLFSSVLIRRSVVDTAAANETHGKPFDARWTNAQDYDLMLRAARQCGFAYIAEPLTFYRVHSQHGAMGNLKRAYGFHCRVQLDFVQRYGREVGIDETEIKGRVAHFLLGRADAAFWRRQFDVARQICDLARELDVFDEGFAAVERKASRPVWIYRMKDRLDRLVGRRAAHTT